MSGVGARADRAPLGLALMAGGVTCFVGIDASAKWLIVSGLPPLQVVLARYLGHLVISLAVFLPREGLTALRSRRPALQLARSACLMGATALNFAALRHLPITLTTTIMFATPIVVTLLSVPLLGERVGPGRLAAVLLGFGGVVIAAQPWGAGYHPAIALSVGALMSTAGYLMLTRRLAGEESNATSQLWSSALAAACVAPFGLRGWVWPETMTGHAVLLGIGAFGVAGHSCVAVAHRFAGASVLAPVVYWQLPVAGLAGLVIFATRPTAWTLLGAAVIVASGVALWRADR